MTKVFQLRQLEWNFLCILFWLPFEMDKYCQILFCILVYLLSFFLFVFHFENVWDSLVCWRAIQWHCLSPSFPTFRPSPHARSKTAVTWLADCHCFTADKKQTSQSATKDRTIAILQKLMMRQSNFLVFSKTLIVTSQGESNPTRLQYLLYYFWERFRGKSYKTEL